MASAETAERVWLDALRAWRVDYPDASEYAVRLAEDRFFSLMRNVDESQDDFDGKGYRTARLFLCEEQILHVDVLRSTTRKEK